jgi:hypothetical protein
MWFSVYEIDSDSGFFLMLWIFPELLSQQPLIQVFDQIAVDDVESYEPGDRPAQVFGGGNGEAPCELENRSGITKSPYQVIALK